MNLLLPGYYGGGNSGDDAALRGLVNIIQAVEPSSYVFQSTNNGAPIGMEKIMPAGVLYKFVWFDHDLESIDAVVINNAGIAGGFPINTIMTALDKGIPVLAPCLKTGMSEDSIYRTIYAHLVPRFKLTGVRLKKNLNAWQRYGFGGVQYLMDTAVYVEPETPEQEPVPEEDYILCFPREATSLFGADTQLKWYLRFIEANPKTNIYFIGLSSCDLPFLSSLQVFSNVKFLPYKGYDFAKVMSWVSKCKLVISTGRFHALIYALNAKKPCILASAREEVYDGITRKGHDRGRFLALTDDYSIPVSLDVFPVEDLIALCSGIDHNEFLKQKTMTKIKLITAFKTL